MYYKIELKDKIQTITAAKNMIAIFERDGWNPDRFRIVEVK